MNQYQTPRYELIRDYQEKCAAMEEDMLGWKERAEAWERDARGLNTRALAAEAKLAEAEKALSAIANHVCGSMPDAAALIGAIETARTTLTAITKGAQSNG